MSPATQSPADVAAAALSIVGLLCKFLAEHSVISRQEFREFVDGEIRRRLESPQGENLVNQQIAGELAELLRLALAS